MMRKPRDIDIVTRGEQARGEVLVLPGRIGHAVKENHGAVRRSAMGQENRATSWSNYAIIGLLLPSDTADRFGVVSGRLGVRDEIAGVVWYDGGERNQKNHAEDGARYPWHLQM